MCPAPLLGAREVIVGSVEVSDEGPGIVAPQHCIRPWGTSPHPATTTGTAIAHERMLNDFHGGRRGQLDHLNAAIHPAAHESLATGRAVLHLVPDLGGCLHPSSAMVVLSCPLPS